MISNSSKTQQTTTIAAAVALAIAAPTTRAADTADQDVAANTNVEEIIVTGTRRAGMLAAESPAPIQIIGEETLRAAAGNPDLLNTIAQVVPSLTIQALGFDMANQTLQARMRGLTSNHMLVLVNGKRRHTTANLAVNTGSPWAGGAGVDLNFIPVDAIDHMEVLTEGAAAQYGTDAIAGVINIILKKDPSDPTLTSTYGRHFDKQGPTADFSGHIGMEPSPGGYLNITGQVHNHGHTNHGGIEPKLINRVNTYPNSNATQLEGYPYINKFQGDAETRSKIALLNAGFLFDSGTELYATASYGRKRAQSYQNYRMPETISYTDPATGVKTYPYPFGFSPQEASEETDYQALVGVRGTAADWNWDVATTYGRDYLDVYTLDSIGGSFQLDGRPTVSDFYDGYLRASQWTTTVDVNRDFEVGWAGPLNVAVGLESRRETYAIGAGVPASYQSGGASAFAGYSPADAGSHDRQNYGGYIDIAGEPISGLRLDAAVRYEDYSDFGSATVGKLTARYDFNPQFAIRGTVSNGFRAPTLAEAYYSSTNVGPTSVFVQLAPNSVGGRMIGLGNGLEPEKSNNYSLGFVFRPMPTLSATLDFYQIEITNRIVPSANIFGTVNGVPTAAAPYINAAIEADGSELDPVVVATGTTGVAVFANGIDTRTRGADFTLNMPVSYGFGQVDYSIGATYNKTTLTKLPAVPPQFAGQTLYNEWAISDLTTAFPKYAINLGASWTWDKLSVSLLQKIYGPSSERQHDVGHNPRNVPEYFTSRIGTIGVTNLDIRYQFTEKVAVGIGANNLFDRFPPRNNSTIIEREFAANATTAVQVNPLFSPIGINGGYYYAKATVTF